MVMPAAAAAQAVDHHPAHPAALRHGLQPPSQGPGHLEERDVCQGSRGAGSSKHALLIQL
jgi:hypothetical protein